MSEKLTITCAVGQAVERGGGPANNIHDKCFGVVCDMEEIQMLIANLDVYRPLCRCDCHIGKERAIDMARRHRLMRQQLNKLRREVLLEYSSPLSSMPGPADKTEEPMLKRPTTDNWKEKP